MELLSRLFFHRPWHAIKLYHSKKVNTLAAAATFYLIMTIVPMSLFIITSVGMALGDIDEMYNWFFSFGEHFIPEGSRNFLTTLKNFLNGPLLKSSSFTLLNIILLSFSGLGFINTIFNGLFLINNDKKNVSLFRNLKGMVLIFSSLIFLLLVLSIDPLLVILEGLFQDNILTTIILGAFSSLKPYFEYIINPELQSRLILKLNLIYLIPMILYFSFVYRWIFHWKITFWDASYAASFFVVLILLGKNLFWIYLSYGREMLAQNYGEFYTFIVVFIWLYFLMSFFYFGACLCVNNDKKCAHD